MARLVAVLVAVFMGVVLWRSALAPSEPRARVPGTDGPVVALKGDALDATLIALLTRVYGAFGEVEEGAIYDGIASAVVPQLATELYLQRRAAQLAEFTEGGRADILELKLTERTPVPGAPGVVDVTWSVLGRVGHGDHQHERFNIYSARLSLAPQAGAWRLAAFDLDAVRREETPLFFDDF